jgi:glycosyltransferase involved in cell wall biosynthesis
VKPLKVLYVYKYLTLGGVEAVLKSRLETLPDFGIHAYAWFLGNHGGKEQFNNHEKRIFVGDDALAISRLSEFDLICSIDTEELIPLLPKASSRTKVVFEAHSPYLENLEYLRSREFKDLNVSRLFVPSKYQKHVVIGLGVQESIVRVIPNPVGAHFFSENCTSLERGVPIIFWIGRLDHLKNWKGFLDILSRLEASPTQYKAIMLGGANQATNPSQIFREIKRRGLSGNVQWIASISHLKMPSMYDLIQSSGGIVISTSNNESFGLAIAEAMARGCVVFAPRSGPFSEFIVERENGFLYELKEIKNTVSLIQDVLVDPHLRKTIGSTARDDITRAHHPVRAVQVLSQELATII